MRIKLVFVIALFLHFCGYSQQTDDTAINEQGIKEVLRTKSDKGFIENLGQMKDFNGIPVPSVLFRTEAPGVAFWITEQGLTIQTLKLEGEGEGEGKKKSKKILWERIDIILDGASVRKENIQKENPIIGHSNYFDGNNPEGIYGVKQYEKITIKEIYKGIDWVFYRKNDGTLKYDFVVQPTADPNQIQLLYRSKSPIYIDENGALNMHTNYGDVQEAAPLSYYAGNEIKTQFKKHSSSKILMNKDSGYESKVTFFLENLTDQRTSNLIIDPEIVWGTFFGGWGIDGPLSTETDNSGNLFVTGYCSQDDFFPTFNPGGGAYFQGEMADVSMDIFILKFSNDGVLNWATYYGGNDFDLGTYIIADNEGNIFITGRTKSTDFPTQDLGGGAYFQADCAGGSDVFILKFNNSGIRQWATYYGGSGGPFSLERGGSMAIDNEGNLFIVGLTESNGLPTEDPGGGAYYQPAINGSKDAFILKFNSSGVREWATYYGGSDRDDNRSVCVDSDGRLFITGITSSDDLPIEDPGGTTYMQSIPGGVAPGIGGDWGAINDAYITRFDAAGVLEWSTYYGGANEDRGNTIRVDDQNNLFVVGSTNSDDITTLDLGGDAFYQGVYAGMHDIFLLRFNDTGTLEWGTYFGGDEDEAWVLDNNVEYLDISPCGELYLAFCTASNDMITVESCDDGYQKDSGADYDQYIAKFNSEGVLKWGTYLGGDGKDVRAMVALDDNGNLFLSGEWMNSIIDSEETYPLTDAGTYFDDTQNGTDDLFFAKFVSAVPEYEQEQLNDEVCDCSGEATATILNACAPYTFNWSTGVIEISDLNTHTITDLCAGEYWVEVISDCYNRDTLYYTIEEIVCGLNISADSDTICIGECTDLLVTVTGAIGDASFSWDNGIIEDAASVNVCPVETTTYQVIVTDDVDADTALVTVVVLPLPIVDLGPNITTCDDELIVDAENIGALYSWIDGSTEQTLLVSSTGTYWVDVNVFGCIVRDSIDLLFGYANVALGNDTVLCDNELILLDADGPFIYEWQDASTNQTFEVNFPGIYSVSITDTLGCSAFDEISIDYSTVVSNFSVNDTIGCAPLITLFADESTADVGDITDWFWEFGDGITSSLENPAHNYFSSGTYSVSLMVINAHECSDTVFKDVIIEIFEQPIAAFSFTPTAPNVGQPVQFIDESIYAEEWYWDFGDGSNSSAQNPTHTYSFLGNKNVQLTVFNNSCVHSIFQQILIDEELIIYVPNVFTPDGDNFNQIFQPVFTAGFDPYDYHLTIYNRWGEIVFESFDATVGWDGTYGMAGLVQDAVYVWEIEFGDINNDKKHLYQGTVNVLK